MKAKVAQRAMEQAGLHYKKAGWDERDVSRLGGGHIGYDLLLQRGDETLTVKVKGSEKEYYGIPDLHGNEISADLQLIADVLFVAYFPPELPVKVAIFGRGDFLPGHLNKKTSYCISSSMKNRRRYSVS